MDTVLYLAARALVALLQALPLAFVARLGRTGGALAWLLDARHRRVALRNLEACFGNEKTPAEIRALAKENFCRIGESFACAGKTAGLSDEEIRAVLSVSGTERAPCLNAGAAARSVVVAVGHFGNFELYPRARLFVPGFQFASTYRGLRQPGLNRVLQSLREKSGCLFFERRTGATALKVAMARPGLLLGLFADQHAGDRGARLPFLGRECSTSVAPAVFALRYDCALITAICYRTAPGRWHIEIGGEIPTHENGRPRSTEEITADVNRAFEAGIRRDPANWFWVHNRWKAPKQGVERPTADDRLDPERGWRMEDGG